MNSGFQTDSPNRSLRFFACLGIVCLLFVNVFAAQYQVSVTSPASCGEISGNTPLNFSAPGMTSATVKSWIGDNSYGHDSVFPAITLTNGSGALTFPANLFPHNDIRPGAYLVTVNSKQERLSRIVVFN